MSLGSFIKCQFRSVAAIHGGSADAVADVAGVEGGDGAVAGGAGGDVAGAEGDARRQRPGLRRQEPQQLQLQARHEAEEQGRGGAGRHPLHHQRAVVQRVTMLHSASDAKCGPNAGTKETMLLDHA